MSTYKKSGCDGVDYAFPTPGKACCPPPPPKPPVRPCPPPPPPFEEDWRAYPFYPPYPEMDAEPVPTPPIPGRPGPIPPVPPMPPHKHPHFPPCPPPPYPYPVPEKTDECSKKLAKLSQKAKVLVQMINDFEKKNKPVIVTIGPNSYQFGTNTVTGFDGEATNGMYANLISAEPIEKLDEMDYTVDDTNTRVALKDPKDLLQSELARVRQEITLVAAALNNEVAENVAPSPKGVLGTDEG